MRASDCEIFFSSLRSRSRVRSSSACSSSMVARSAGSGTIDVSSRRCSVVSPALDSKSSFSACRRVRKNSSCFSFMYSSSGIASSSSSVSSRPDLFFQALTKRGSALTVGRTGSTGSGSERCGGRGGAKRSVKRLPAAVAAGLAWGLSEVLAKVGSADGGTGEGLTTAAPTPRVSRTAGLGAATLGVGSASAGARPGLLSFAIGLWLGAGLWAAGLVLVFVAALGADLLGALAGGFGGNFAAGLAVFAAVALPEGLALALVVFTGLAGAFGLAADLVDARADVPLPAALL